MVDGCVVPTQAEMDAAATLLVLKSDECVVLYLSSRTVLEAEAEACDFHKVVW